MSFKIPSRYRHPIIIAYLLREKLGEWSPQRIRREFTRDRLKDYELEECYFLLEQRFTSIGDFCQDKNYTFFIKTENDLHVFSEGPPIFFDQTKARIFSEVYNLYSIPRGIKNNFTTVTEILSAMQISSREDWEDEEMTFETITQLEDWFDLKIEVWSKFLCTVQNRVLYKHYYTGNPANSKTFVLHWQQETETYFMVDDTETYFEKLFQCQTEGCYFTFRSKKHLDLHEKLCGLSEVKVIQEELGPSGKLIEKAEKAKLIPKCEYNRNFIFFDIESVLPNSNITTKKTKVLSTHELVSIAVNRLIFFLVEISLLDNID